MLPQRLTYRRRRSKHGDRIEDVHAAALARFAIPPERRTEFDAIFRAIFLGQTVAADADGEENETDAYEPDDSAIEVELDEGQDPSGAEATAAERLADRPLIPGDDSALARFERLAPKRLPLPPSDPSLRAF